MALVQLMILVRAEKRKRLDRQGAKAAKEEEKRTSFRI